jgi:hypothetical protein
VAFGGKPSGFGVQSREAEEEAALTRPLMTRTQRSLRGSERTDHALMVRVPIDVVGLDCGLRSMLAAFSVVERSRTNASVTMGFWWVWTALAAVCRMGGAGPHPFTSWGG